MQPAAASALPEARPPTSRRLLWLVGAGALALLGGLATRLFGPPWLGVPVLGLGTLALLVCVFWDSGATLVGPLFFYDLVRLARRGRSTLLRFGYVLFLFVVLYFLFDRRFPQYSLLHDPFAPGPAVGVSEMARFASSFATALLALQGMAVIVLTPAYLAGAIAEERERRTLELLFTTHLSDREIILGKLFGRLTHLAGLLLASLPILSLLQLWGGIDLLVMLSGFAVTALTLLSVGSVSILCSVVSRTSLNAVLSSYAIVLSVTLITMAVPGCFVFSPLAFMAEVEQQMGVNTIYETVWGISGHGAMRGMGQSTTVILAMLLGYAIVHGGVALGCIISAMRQVRGGFAGNEPIPVARVVTASAVLAVPRPVERPPDLPAARVTDGWDPADLDLPWRRVARPAPGRPRYPVTDPPLLWKEVYHGANEMAGVGFWVVYGSVLAMLLLLLGPLVFLFAVEAAQQGTEPALAALPRASRDVLNPAVRGLGAALMAAWCLSLAWQAAGSITREREQQTLGALLTLPAGRTQVLVAKWLGCILRYRWLGSCLLAVWTFGMLTGALHPATVALLALACGVHAAFLASLGLWLSLVSRNTLWAYLSMALMLLLMFLGSWVMMAYSRLLLGTPPGEGWWEKFAAVGLNPLRTWWTLGLGWQQFTEDVCDAANPLQGEWGAALAGLLIYGLAAGLLWLASCQRFRSEQTGGGKG